MENLVFLCQIMRKKRGPANSWNFSKQLEMKSPVKNMKSISTSRSRAIILTPCSWAFIKACPKAGWVLWLWGQICSLSHRNDYDKQAFHKYLRSNQQVRFLFTGTLLQVFPELYYNESDAKYPSWAYPCGAQAGRQTALLNPRVFSRGRKEMILFPKLLTSISKGDHKHGEKTKKQICQSIRRLYTLSAQRGRSP